MNLELFCKDEDAVTTCGNKILLLKGTNAENHPNYL